MEAFHIVAERNAKNGTTPAGIPVGTCHCVTGMWLASLCLKLTVIAAASFFFVVRLL